MSVIISTLPAQVTPVGDLFDLSLVVTSHGVQLTGVDIGLSITGAELLGRDLVGSDFPDAISVGLGGDLGGSVADVLAPLGDGDHLVARMHFRVVHANASVVPERFSGTIGYATAAPGFVEHPFDGFFGSSVSVPESAGMFLLGGLVIGLLGRMVRR